MSNTEELRQPQADTVDRDGVLANLLRDYKNGASFTKTLDLIDALYTPEQPNTNDNLNMAIKQLFIDGVTWGRKNPYGIPLPEPADVPGIVKVRQLLPLQPDDLQIVDPKHYTLPGCPQHGVYNEGESCRKCPAQPAGDDEVERTLVTLYHGASDTTLADSATYDALRRSPAIQKALAAIAHIREADRAAAHKREVELLDSLYWMYIQYCSDGHLFMNAGETASELLENADYITVDGTGRVINDNGDSDEQRARLTNTEKDMV